MVVEDADRLTDQAANALLKAIEEPTERTVWLLCAPTVEDVLPTIRSRTRLVVLATPVGRRRHRLPGPRTRGSASRPRRTPPAPARATSAAPVRSPATRTPGAVAARWSRSPAGCSSLGACMAAAADLHDLAKEEAEALTSEHDQREKTELDRAYGVVERGRRPREYAPALRDMEKSQKTRAKRRVLDVVDRGPDGPDLGLPRRADPPAGHRRSSWSTRSCAATSSRWPTPRPPSRRLRRIEAVLRGARADAGVQRAAAAGARVDDGRAAGRARRLSRRRWRPAPTLGGMSDPLPAAVPAAARRPGRSTAVIAVAVALTVVGRRRRRSGSAAWAAVAPRCATAAAAAASADAAATPSAHGRAAGVRPPSSRGSTSRTSTGSACGEQRVRPADGAARLRRARRASTIELAVLRVPATDRGRAGRAAGGEPGRPRRLRRQYAAAGALHVRRRSSPATTTSSASTRAASARAPRCECADTEQTDEFLGADPDPDDQAEVDTPRPPDPGVRRGAASTNSGELARHISIGRGRQGHGRPPRRAGRAAAGLPRRVLRHPARRDVRRPVPHPRAPDGARRRDRPGAVQRADLPSGRPAASRRRSTPTSRTAWARAAARSATTVGRGAAAGRATCSTQIDADPLPTSGGRELTEGLATYGIFLPLYVKELLAAR